MRTPERGNAFGNKFRKRAEDFAIRSPFFRVICNSRILTKRRWPSRFQGGATTGKVNSAKRQAALNARQNMSTRGRRGAREEESRKEAGGLYSRTGDSPNRAAPHHPGRIGLGLFGAAGRKEKRESSRREDVLTLRGRVSGCVRGVASIHLRRAERGENFR